VHRDHLELFGRWMEETGRMRSTVARRLPTLASFCRYCEQERVIERNPALNEAAHESANLCPLLRRQSGANRS
jgi:site-specific recombinase XerD